MIEKKRRVKSNGEKDVIKKMIYSTGERTALILVLVRSKKPALGRKLDQMRATCEIKFLVGIRKKMEKSGC